MCKVFRYGGIVEWSEPEYQRSCAALESGVALLVDLDCMSDIQMFSLGVKSQCSGVLCCMQVGLERIIKHFFGYKIRTCGEQIDLLDTWPWLRVFGFCISSGRLVRT